MAIVQQVLVTQITAQRWIIVLCLFSLSCFVAAAPTFPKLTGRVVDEVSLLDRGSKAQLRTLLQQHEQATGNQIAVAIIKDLQGYEIQDYGYQLGRHWKLGQKGKDNGAVLIIAPNDRKITIQVGYGLEGQLTDVISHNIIQTKISPAFRQNQFAQGITAGVTSMISALGGEYKVVPTRQGQRQGKREKSNWLPLFMFLVFGLQFIGGSRRGGRRGLGRGLFIGSMIGAASGRGGFGGGSGGFGGGGFSGGGGGFGGGGASGGW